MKAKLTSSDFPQVALVNERYEEATGDYSRTGTLVEVSGPSTGLAGCHATGEDNIPLLFFSSELDFLGPL